MCFSFFYHLYFFPSRFSHLETAIMYMCFLPFCLLISLFFYFLYLFPFAYFFSSSLLYPSPVQIDSKKHVWRHGTFFFCHCSPHFSFVFSSWNICQPCFCIFFRPSYLLILLSFYLLYFFTPTSFLLSCCTFPRFTLTKIFTILAPSHLSFCSFIFCPAHDHTNLKQGNRLEGMGFHFVFPLSFFPALLFHLETIFAWSLPFFLIYFLFNHPSFYLLLFLFLCFFFSILLYLFSLRSMICFVIFSLSLFKEMHISFS